MARFDRRNSGGNGAISQKCSRPWQPIFRREPVESAMMRLCVIVIVPMLLGSGAGFAQVNLPGMSDLNTGAMPVLDSLGNPSAIGGMSTAAPVGGAGIPLGTTELFAGGLSPSPTDLATPNPTCPGASPIPGVGTLGTGSIFAGNGTMATSTSDIASSIDPIDSACGAAPPAGAGPLGLTSSLGTAPAFAGGNIPLGATALSATGLGGTIGVPAPGSLSPCIGLGGLTAGTGLAPAGSISMSGVTSATSC
jgi:hypothetical protein